MEVSIKILFYFAILTEIKLVRRILLKNPGVKFDENSSLEAEVFRTKTKETDRYNEANSRFSIFLKRL
jgi:hypothetical protein